MTKTYAKFKDFSIFETWMQTEFSNSVYNTVCDTATNGIADKKLQQSLAAASYSLTRGFSGIGPREKVEQQKEEYTRAQILKHAQKMHTYSVDFSEPIQVAYHTEEIAFLYLGTPSKATPVLCPSKHLDMWLEECYDDMTPTQAKQQFLGTNAPTQADYLLYVGDCSKNQLVAQATQQESALAELQEQIDRTRKGETEELKALQDEIARMQAQLQEKIDIAMADLQHKQETMEAAKKALEDEIYILDSQIYAIRCYAGQVVKFTQIKKGHTAPKETPIVVHQKLRFLDEDLGKLTSIYSIDWADIQMFEDFLANNPNALETFAPNDRCIVLVRISKNGVRYNRLDKGLNISNVLAEYEYFHGQKVGIILRNGDNLYVGWTDEDRIDIQDDLIIGKIATDITPVQEDAHYVSSFEQKRQQEALEKQKERVKRGLMSRTFVYNILQGVIDNTDILPLPLGETLGKQSQYVKYAIADTWLADSQFEPFGELVRKSNELTKEGDTIVATNHLVPERSGAYSYGNDTWVNSRGRGSKNRTRDCRIENGAVYTVNLVEYDAPIQYTSYKVKRQTPEGDTVTYKSRQVPEDILRNYADDKNFLGIVGTTSEKERHVFVSLPRESWQGTISRSNFEVYDNEYINTTYLSSAELTWVATTKNLGDWTIDGVKVDFAHAIPYINTAIQLVRRREAEEKAIMDQVQPGWDNAIEDWTQKLVEWKRDKEIRTITSYQAKRFLRSLSQ